jgi:hypothetical protein
LEEEGNEKYEVLKIQKTKEMRVKKVAGTFLKW